MSGHPRHTAQSAADGQLLNAQQDPPADCQLGVSGARQQEQLIVILSVCVTFS